MNKPLLALIASQFLFSCSDFMGRYYMKQHGFALATFLSLWFAIYFLIRTIAMFLVLYVFTTMDLGRVIAWMSAASIVIANVLGLLVLKELLSPVAYVGVSLAVVTVLLLAWR